MNVIRRVILIAFAALAGFGQTAPPPQFEVASIRPAPPFTPGQVSLGLRIDGSQVSLRQFALKDSIAIAFNLKQYQVVGPDWLATERFDIVAKLPEGAPRDQVRAMLQALFLDRFQMKTHHETRDFSVYALVVAKSGLKMKEVPPDPTTDPPDGEQKSNRGAVNVSVSGGRGGVVANYGNGSYVTLGDNRIEAKKMQMNYVADMLARFEDKPLVDMTELQGKYDFTLIFAEEDYRAMMIRAAISSGMALPPEAIQAMQSASGDSLFSALQAVGLKLESRKAPLDVLVIDHAEKTPTEN
ncbi:MAG: TIGR03435 family protein [Bryobacteraceae bacterium]